MNWLKDLIKENPFLAISLPALMSGMSFVGHLLVYLSDGVLDGNELHELMASANGAEMLVLVLIMFALKNKKK